MKTVLVVEDNEDIRTIAVEVLRKEGYTVYEAENGRRALEVLDQLGNLPCLILLDMMMPIMDGGEFLRHVGEHHTMASLPVVVVSAGITSTNVSGAQRVIRKPLSVDLLKQVVKEFCGEP